MKRNNVRGITGIFLALVAAITMEWRRGPARQAKVASELVEHRSQATAVAPNDTATSAAVTVPQVLPSVPPRSASKVNPTAVSAATVPANARCESDVAGDDRPIAHHTGRAPTGRRAAR